jgi:hypothetical protein
VRSGQDEPAVLDRGHGQNPARLEHTPHLDECVGWSIEGLEDGMSEHGIGVVVRQPKRVRVADLEAGVADA